MAWIRGGVSVAAVLSLAAGAQGQTDEQLRQRIAELESRSRLDATHIAELEARLGRLEGERDADWLGPERAEEIRALVEDVLADADTRSSLLWGVDAGYDDGAVLSSGNGNWLLRTNLLMQQRFVFNNQSNSPSGDSTSWGFEVARARFIMTGNVVAPEWFYKVEVELSGVNTGLPNGESRTGLLDAYLGYDFGNGWKIGAGTFKTPLLREELVESRYQLAVERSVFNYLFTGGRTDGLAVDYLGENLHFTASYNNGINDAFFGGAVSTGGTSPITSPTTDFAISARGEFLIEGEWDRFYDFTSPRGEKTAMMAGAAMHFQTADNDAPGVPDVDLFILTGDFTGKFDGWSVFGEIVFANASRAAAPDATTIGVLAQGSYYFTKEWEGFARFEWADLDTLAPDDLAILTVGATRYFASHNAQWTTDIGIGFDAVPATVPIADYRQDAAGENGQIVIRSQFQFVF